MATVSGTAGNDTLYGDQNGSTLEGLEGDDTLVGHNGRDSLFGGSGNDRLAGGNNDDRLFGGDGTDTLDGGDGRDLLYGGGGDDSISGAGGQDVIYGGAGTDIIDGGSDSDKVDGGADNDTIHGGGGNDTLEGGDGDDYIYGGEGQDTLFGGSGNDMLLGGGSNPDTIYGGAGDDTILGGGNQGSHYGGTGDDTFVIENDGSNFNNIFIDGGEDIDDGDIDVLDLSEYFDADPGTQIIYEAGGPDTESGRILLKSSTGQEFGRITYSNIEAISTTPICFTPGTIIATPDGERDVASLREGDKVFTRDNSVQEIRWIGRHDLGADDLLAKPEFQPVMVRAGSLGHGQPERDLLLSPNHRVLMTNARASLYFEENEVLCAAKHMTNVPGVDQVKAASVSYIHMMFNRHEVVLSNGAWTESFQPGDYSLRGVGADQRAEIVSLFPEFDGAKTDTIWPAARRVLKRYEARALLN